jgi:hypothetical protein
MNKHKMKSNFYNTFLPIILLFIFFIGGKLFIKWDDKRRQTIMENKMADFDKHAALIINKFPEILQPLEKVDNSLYFKEAPGRKRMIVVAESEIFLIAKFNNKIDAELSLELQNMLFPHTPIIQDSIDHIIVVINESDIVRNYYTNGSSAGQVLYKIAILTTFDHKVAAMDSLWGPEPTNLYHNRFSGKTEGFNFSPPSKKQIKQILEQYLVIRR